MASKKKPKKRSSWTGWAILRSNGSPIAIADSRCELWQITREGKADGLRYARIRLSEVTP